jgi:hypothetical protein
MVTIRENVKVTIPAMDIEQKHAEVIKAAPARYSVWWSNAHIPSHKNSPSNEPDITVPNEMIIVEP